MSPVRPELLAGGGHRSLWQSVPRWVGFPVVVVLTAVMVAEIGFASLSTFWSTVSLSYGSRELSDVVTGTVSLLLAAIAGLAYGVTLAVLFARRWLALIGIGLAVPLLVAGLALYFASESANPHPTANEFPWDQISPYVGTPLWWIPILAMLAVLSVEAWRRFRRTNS